jgi:hypothetical protein
LCSGDIVLREVTKDKTTMEIEGENGGVQRHSELIV